MARREISDTASESYSVASSTIVDTWSEPPRYSGKFADKIISRAAAELSAQPDPDEESVTPSMCSKSVSPKTAASRTSRTASSRSWLPQDDTMSKASARSSTKPSQRAGQSTKAQDASISGSSRTSSKKKGVSSSSSRATRTGSSRSVKSYKSSATSSQSVSGDPGNLALVPRKASVDPPSASSNCEEDATNYDPPCISSTNRHVWGEEETEKPGEEESQLDTILSGSEESYYSEEESSESRSSYEDEDTLVEATNNALAIRDNDVDITEPSSAEDGNSRALVHVEGGSNNYDEQAIVRAPGRYLAAAVDNNFAVVPMDSTVYESYDHTFVACPEHLRFRFLYTFLKKNLDKKIMIFFSTTNSAKFYARLLKHFHITVLTMHGKQKREQFINTFFKFSDLEEGILCATDAAGKDLDIPPSVDWVIQFEPPDDPSEYILRVARISCDSDRVGRSLLFLNPGEQGFLKYYHAAAIPVSEFEIPKLADIQAHIEYHVNENERLLNYARDAYGSYLIAYASHSYRDVYNVHDLNKDDVAASFGLVSLPAIDDDSDEDVSDASDDVTRVRASSRERKERNKKKGWKSEKKEKKKTWMKSEKSWPHCQIKVHPKFRDGYVPREEFKE